MAFVAGAFARSSAAPLQQEEFAQLQRALQIGPTDVAGFARSPRLHLAWTSLDGSCRDARSDTDGSLSLLWGCLYRDQHSDEANQEFLHEELRKSAPPQLGSVSGDFGFAFHDAAQDVLHLVTDKMGVRALFVYCDDARVWFSSSLKVMERLPGVRKVMSFRAVTEIAFFGYPLGDRTPYRDVRVLRPCEKLRIDAEHVRSEFYWRWNTLPAWQGSREDCVQDLAARFRTAIRRRSGRDRRVFCLLSGGLDSRMIATALREQQVAVNTCNFSPLGTQDQVYGEQVARALGCQHTSLPLQEGRAPNPFAQLSDAWHAGLIPDSEAIDRLHWVFVGVGGGTFFGTMFWDEELIALFRSGRIREGVERYFRVRGWKLIERLYRSRNAAHLREELVESVLEQLRDFPCEDSAQTFHLFEALNDQRRFMHSHWENAAAHGMQFHLPYFDSHLLERALTFPLEWGLYHDLYDQWMRQFDPAARSVPWQVYPGHKPCPVPVTQTFPTQWENSGKYVLSSRAAASGTLREIMATRPFPEFLNRNYLRFVQLRRALGADYAYAIKAAGTYRDVWVCSGGRFTWS